MRRIHFRLNGMGVVVAGLLLAAVSCQREAVGGDDVSSNGRDVRFLGGVEAFESGDALVTKGPSRREFSGGPAKLVLYSVETEWDGMEAMAGSDGIQTKTAPATEVHPYVFVNGYQFAGTWDGTAKPTLGYKVQLNNIGTLYDYNDVSQTIRWPGSDYNVRFYGVSLPSNYVSSVSWSTTSSSEGAPTISYTVPTNNVTNQVDILDAVSSDIVGDGEAVSGTVSMTFRHALTGVKFRANEFGANVRITRIELSGIYTNGTHEVGATGAGAWTGQSTTGTFALTPNVDVTVSGTDIAVSSGVTEFLMMPQTLPSGAKVSVTLRWNGNNFVIESDLSGEVWEAGKEITYTISLAESDWVANVLTLGNLNGTIPDWSTSITAAKVYSFRLHASGIRTALPWSVEYSSDGGTTFSAEPPAWITGGTQTGRGGWSGEDLTFNVPSRSQTMFPLASTFGATQGNPSNYIDLSKVHPLTRASMPRETANCYIVNAPGYYKIPLFYGNAIVNGSANAAAYPLQSGNANYGYFYNAYGEEIGRSGGSGNIASDLTAGGHTLNTSGGRLVWCTGNENLVVVDSDLENGGDGVYYLKFRVPEGSIQEGNAVVGVLKDGSTNEFVWSWHVWIVSNEMNLMTETYTNAESTNIDMLNWALGATQFTKIGREGHSYVVRVKNAAAEQVFTLSQAEVINSSFVPSTYYQWGRPNALPPTTVTSATPDISYGSTDWSWTQTAVSNMAQTISKPYNAYWNGSFSGGGKQTNLWDADMNVVDSDQPVNKTVYDPCPAGFSVPRYKFSTYFSTTNNVGSFTSGYYFKKTPSDPTGSFWAASGGRFNGGGLDGVGTRGYYWSATAYSSQDGRYLSLNSGSVDPVNYYYRYNGFSVRPAVCSVP